MTATIPRDLDPLKLFKRHAAQPHLFFLDSSLSKRGSRSFIGHSPVELVKAPSLAGLKRVLSLQAKHRLLAVGYITYEGAICFGLYEQWLEITHHPHREVSVTRPNSRTQARVKGKSNFSKKQYMSAVNKVLAAITRGDIYQLNLSRKVVLDVQVDPQQLYLALRSLSPSEFSAYFHDGQQVLISSSPERFLKLTRDVACVKPMKGTRPRGKTPRQDQRHYHDLLLSPKEIAELLMVTDLERNDLGKVCRIGSVRVRNIRSIERYASVFQATALIEGRLRPDCDRVKLLQATFPSGSVTGCPKIEAMKIIRRLEKIPRGFYTGALGYIAPNGDMDFSVLIRSLAVTKTRVTYHVGGGIVADSDPAKEYAETVLKAQAMEQAIEQVRK